MNAAALNNLLTYIRGLGLSQSNRPWLDDRLIEPETQNETADVVMTQTAEDCERQLRAEEYLKQRCSDKEYAELMATDFLNSPYPPFCNQTEEEIIQEIIDGEKEGYLSEEETLKWLNSLAS